MWTHIIEALISSLIILSTKDGTMVYTLYPQHILLSAQSWHFLFVVDLGLPPLGQRIISISCTPLLLDQNWAYAICASRSLLELPLCKDLKNDIFWKSFFLGWNLAKTDPLNHYSNFKFSITSSYSNFKFSHLIDIVSPKVPFIASLLAPKMLVRGAICTSFIETVKHQSLREQMTSIPTTFQWYKA